MVTWLRPIRTRRNPFEYQRLQESCDRDADGKIQFSDFIGFFHRKERHVCCWLLGIGCGFSYLCKTATHGFGALITVQSVA